MPEEPSNRPDRRPPSPQIRFGRNTMFWAGAVLLALLVATWWAPLVSGPEEIDPRNFWQHLKNNEIKKLVIDTYENRLKGEFKPGIPGRAKDATAKFYVVMDFSADRTKVQQLEEALRETDTVYSFAKQPPWYRQILPYVVLYGGLLLLVWFFLFRRLGQAGGGAGFLGSFGRSRHRVATREAVDVTFEDVCGIEEAKEEVKEIIEFLRNPRRFQRLGGRVPRGVLLVGEPGCGKTLLAKAIAGEADVPFFSISGSDFVEMFVGVGASRVRDLFRQAKESSPCIIFLDEIDAVGRRRGTGFNGGGHDEREQTLNAILVEMDGFDTNDQVIVIAATNRMDVLDPALTRPGRFDRQVQVPLPDIKGRYEILKLYASKVRCGPDVDLHRIARGTPMFSGADLEALVNEAAIAATMANKDYVGHADMEEARDQVRWGRQRKSRVIDEREKEMTAYHEAGHALVQVLSPDADPLHKVSIIPRGAMGGATFSLPEKDRYLHTKRWCDAILRVLVAGRISEEKFCGDVDSGAAQDIAQATELARKMVMEWGMSDRLSFIRYAPGVERQAMFDLGGKEYSEKTAEIIDEEIKTIMARAYKDTTAIIEANQDRIARIAQGLLKYETLSVEDVKKILDGQDLDKPSMNELLAQEAAKARRPAPASGERPKTEGAPGHGPIPEPG
ncbi:MAG TPA: ATP-dependent zinc metalloprotease FtsH [Phycisphaerae bacterium]|nr:ATP-dependent zinc metalloprotease FtsH [Phycisphaerae bacterium]